MNCRSALSEHPHLSTNYCDHRRNAVCSSAAPDLAIQYIAEAAAPTCKSESLSACHHTMINQRTSRLAHTETSPQKPHRRLGRPPKATLRAPSTGTRGHPAVPPPQTRHPSIAHLLLRARLDLDELARPAPRHPSRCRANLNERRRRRDHRRRRRRHVQCRPLRGGKRRRVGRRDWRRRRRRRRWQGYQPPRDARRGAARPRHGCGAHAVGTAAARGGGDQRQHRQRKRLPPGGSERRPHGAAERRGWHPAGERESTPAAFGRDRHGEASAQLSRVDRVWGGEKVAAGARRGAGKGGAPAAAVRADDGEPRGVRCGSGRRRGRPGRKGAADLRRLRQGGRLVDRRQVGRASREARHVKVQSDGPEEQEGHDGDTGEKNENGEAVAQRATHTGRRVDGGDRRGDGRAGSTTRHGCRGGRGRGQRRRSGSLAREERREAARSGRPEAWRRDAGWRPSTRRLGSSELNDRGGREVA
ncbi:hypothetical protein BU14_0106s0008 [Porphyra umbilicalis]|uniref:Uncharacterized protein n=1 Tax=Porphyra umbilicalis TaxID=2786 RepID=A0A1X6PCF2_PORUM|nr:hypothetical protein BU14_0106s0008 [Porphyra umbilicalis]|eukprot:OSX78542.1 hypothetical protein BU14_0106s0008 [Porphyra umbilicalis]